VLSTAGAGLHGDAEGNFIALNAATGKALWHFPVRRLGLFRRRCPSPLTGNNTWPSRQAALFSLSRCPELGRGNRGAYYGSRHRLGSAPGTDETFGALRTLLRRGHAERSLDFEAIRLINEVVFGGWPLSSCNARFARLDNPSTAATCEKCNTPFPCRTRRSLRQILVRKQDGLRPPCAPVE